VPLSEIDGGEMVGVDLIVFPSLESTCCGVIWPD
jgi:hypothetical protein